MNSFTFRGEIYILHYNKFEFYPILINNPY